MSDNKLYLVEICIPWRIKESEDLNGSNGSIRKVLHINANNRSDAKIKAVQEMRKRGKGLYWKAIFNRNPFKYIVYIKGFREKFF